MGKRTDHGQAFYFIIPVLILSSCSFSSKTSQRYFDKAKNKTYDMIVMPAFLLQKPVGTAPWKQGFTGRSFFLTGALQNIMYSGSSVHSPYYEGQIMALYAIALGIPQQNVFYETKAEHSTENLYYSYYNQKNWDLQVLHFPPTLSRPNSCAGMQKLK